MKKQLIIAKFKDMEMHFIPLNNGKCEYLVDFHDFGNLESLIERTLTKKQLDYYLENPKDYIRDLRYN